MDARFFRARERHVRCEMMARAASAAAHPLIPCQSEHESWGQRRVAMGAVRRAGEVLRLDSANYAGVQIRTVLRGVEELRWKK